MIVERTRVAGVVVITPEIYEDERGYFKEVINPYTNFDPVQINTSVSKKGVVRGMHAQPGVAKLVWVVKGSVLDVVMHPITGESHQEMLSAESHKQMLVPPDFFHGFQALEEDTIVCYAMSDYYNPYTEMGVSPLSVEWPIDDLTVSKKDRDAPQLFS